jgi:phenylalanyl-tRNA synthetase beta chain
LKFSYQWLSELVPGLAVDPTVLERMITTKTAECEGIEAAGTFLASVKAVRVLSVSALPKGKNKAVSIDTGNGAPVSVVCGAPNVREGLITAWVPPGTSLDGKVIGRAVIEGVTSEGMLASGEELGINRDHSGIVELEGVQSGQQLPRLSPDWIIEIDNKSLTHRPDLWGHFGMAREIAAITGGTLRDPVNRALLPGNGAGFGIEIEDFALCPRYSALVFENVKVGPSPLWLQARLQRIGLNPINNVVDVTNYILAELPQPMHAFDADKLEGTTIFVRRAVDGEQLTALNGETYSLNTSDLVIADKSGAIALAGVIGGAYSAISDTTTRIVLESANFQASSIRLTSARHKLRTDASMRFEKALDPENTVRGLARAMELFAEVCPGIRIAGGLADRAAIARTQEPIPLTTEFVGRKLGKQVSQAEISRILGSLGFGVSEVAPGALSVTVPSWRATKDISLKDDLVEEVGRMIGYEEITPAAPLVASVVPPANPERAYVRRMRDELAAQGFTEVHNYSFVNEADVRRLQCDIATHVAVQNPIASDLTHLRNSLLPGLFKNVLTNARNFVEFRLFEIGNEIHPMPHGGMPDERPHVAALLFNSQGDQQDFFELKRVLECVFPGAQLHAADARAYEHPARTAEVYWSDRVIGRMFEVHPALLKDEGIEGRAFVFDIDVRASQEIAAQRVVKYVPPRKYPTSGFDLSVIASLRTAVAEIERALTMLGGADVASLDFVRQYAGPPLERGEKSVSYHLEVGASDRTLTAEEVSAIRSRIVMGLRQRGFEIRGEE